MSLNKYEKAAFSCAAAAVMIGFAPLEAPGGAIVGFGGMTIGLLFTIYFLVAK
jgi:hypothetical protein